MSEDRRLVERERELTAIDRATALTATGAGRAILFEGQPGVGKTSLVSAAADRCARAGMHVLKAAGAELEQDLGWGVVRSLFGETLSDPARRAVLLRGAAAAAAPLFTPVRRPIGADPGPILHGLYWLISDLAGEQPVVIVVDDVHWVDPPSLRWLVYLCARIADLAALMVLAGRPDRRSSSWQSLAAMPGSSVFELRPLTVSGTGSVVSERFGPGHDRLANACHEATGGNPFLLGEVLHHVMGLGTPTPEQILGLRPDSIRRHVLLRLSQLGPDATRLAFALAVLGRQATLPLASALASLGAADAADAADALCAADVITLSPQPGFVHPLVLDVIEHEIPAGQLGELHRRAAMLLASRGASNGELAPHLLATPADGRAEVVATLRSAAGEELALGAPEVAASYLRRALAEPPGEDDLTPVLIELGRAEGMLADPAGIARLREAMRRLDGPVPRAHVALELAGQLILAGEVEEAVALSMAAALDLPESERELQLEVLASAQAAGGQDLRIHPGDIQAVELATLTGATRAERALLAASANVRLNGSEAPIETVYELAERALAGNALLEDAGAGSAHFWGAASVALFAERYDEYERIVTLAAEDSARRGSQRGYGLSLCFGSPLHFRLGRLAEAIDDARRALEIFTAEPLVHAYALSFLLEGLTERGELAEARAAVGELDLDGLPPVASFAMLRGCHARLLRLEGDPVAARRELLSVGEQYGELSPAFWPWRTEAALACLAAGDTDRARALARDEAARGQRVRSRWVQSAALTALALAEGSIEPLEQAEELTRDWPTRLERARVLVELGAALRRDGRAHDARPFLREGMDLADRCGASPIAERARDELAIATGSRPRRARISGVEALTPSELRVCRMAAGGRSNRDIAQALFVSLRTVETHLTHAYDKLEISSRRGLAQALQNKSLGERSVTRGPACNQSGEQQRDTDQHRA